MQHRIEPQSAVAFRLEAGDRLSVIDPLGEQVGDLVAYNADDVLEVLSNGRTLDYAATLYLTTGAILYSNRSKPMLEIVADDVGRHDFLLTPCSCDTFRIIYGDANPKTGCFEHLAGALAPYGIGADDIPVAFNCFMTVEAAADGRLSVLPPRSRAGSTVVFEARMPLICALSACSAPQSNNGSFKPIDYRIDR